MKSIWYPEKWFFWFITIGSIGCNTVEQPYTFDEKGAWIQNVERQNDSTSWVLVWEDQFDTGHLDTNKWTKIGLYESERFKKQLPDLGIDKNAWKTIRNAWSSYMTAINQKAVQFSNNSILLNAVINTDTTGFDNRPYHTGGIWTEQKFAFQYGRVEIRARLEPAYGAWPAIWMLPFNPKYNNQHNGEIDIMERLNHDTFVYQTIHSHWNLNLGLETPKRFDTGSIEPDSFHVYSVAWYPDKLILAIDGKTVLSYPKLSGGGTFQWPFDQPFYLILDQQLEGWPGNVTKPEELPITMEIDWVRLYQ